jgi:hypothetical protein
MGQLFLCFYGDGTLWDNILLLPAYPSGYSYFRPFRYRDNWIQGDLLDKMSNEEKRKAMIGSEAILCMRFLAEEHKWKLLPVRKASITHIDYLPDNHSFYFSVGPFYDFRTIEELNKACLELDVRERSVIGESLFFFSELTTLHNDFVSEEKEDAIWVRFSDLVAKERILPLKEEAKRGLFMRFRKPSREHPAPVGVIHKTWHFGEIHGSTLSEGSTYELVFFHRTPTLIGTRTSVKKIPVEYKAPTGNVELNRSEEDFTGNYQTHVLSITALKPSGTWEEIVIAPKQESVEAQDGQIINTVRLPIPVKVNKSIRYRLKTTYIWLGLLWLSLFANVVITRLLEGKTNLPLIIISAIASLISAIAVFLLQQKGVSK